MTATLMSPFNPFSSYQIFLHPLYSVVSLPKLQSLSSNSSFSEINLTYYNTLHLQINYCSLAVLFQAQHLHWPCPNFTMLCCHPIHNCPEAFKVKLV